MSAFLAHPEIIVQNFQYQRRRRYRKTEWRQFSGLPSHGKHWWWARTRPISGPSIPSARFHSGLVAVQARIVAPGSGGSFVESASHRSAAHPGDEPSSADPKRLSSRPALLPAADGASPDELRREWRRLYRSEPPRIGRDMIRDRRAGGLRSTQDTLQSLRPLGGGHCHVNQKFAGQMTIAATIHAAIVAWRHVSIA